MLHVEIETTGAAFDDASYELSRILRKLSIAVGNDATTGALHDINGNRVGTYWMEEN